MLLGNDGTKDVGEFVGRLFEKSYSTDLRILLEQGVTDEKELLLAHLQENLRNNFPEFAEKVIEVLNTDYSIKNTAQKSLYPHEEHPVVKRILQSNLSIEDEDELLQKQIKMDENRQA
jgi:hypothetical protein